MKDTAAIILAGGKGHRFGNSYPKQFLPLGGKPVVLHSVEVFSSFSSINEIIVVAPDEFHSLFHTHCNLVFAKPGTRRQDSLFNGLQKVSPHINWICIHDGARPFINHTLLSALFSEGKQVKAATLGVPTKATIKEVSHDKKVLRTLHRETLFEIQTPQFIAKEILIEGFNLSTQNNLSVTDDVSLAELLGYPVKIVEGSSTNIKITHPEDLFLAEQLLQARMFYEV